MSEVTPNRYVSWAEVYQALRSRAEASRGVQSEQADGVPEAIPNTTAADGYRLALVFDQSVYDHTPASLVSRWTSVTERLIAEPEEAPGPYVANRALWGAIATAALELDRAHAPLPSPQLVDDALVSLGDEPPASDAPTAPRNAGATHMVTVFEESTWRGMALRQLGFFRVLRGEMQTTTPLMPAVPATTNAEVLALARYWQQQVALSQSGERLSSHQTYQQVVYAWWYSALHDVAKRAKHAPGADPYPYNADFWTALLLLTTQSDHSQDVPLPWAFHVAGTGGMQNRNADPSGSLSVGDGKVINFDAVKTWDDAARAQRDALAQLRGSDTVSGGLVALVPRTTIGDVQQLASFWTMGLIRVGVHREQDISYKHIVERWFAETDHLRAIPPGTPSNTVYARNREFWEALMTIAAQVGVTDETPTKWQLVKESVVQAVKDVPSGNWVDKVGDFGNKLIASGGEVLTRALARPLLYIGGGALGLTVAWLLIRRPAKGVAERVS